MVSKAPGPFGGATYTRNRVGRWRSLAMSPQFDRGTRVWFAAMGWCNASGHAPFAKGSLAQILSLEGVPAGRTIVSHAIRDAKVRGHIEWTSRARCLVVNRNEVSQGFGETGCTEHPFDPEL